MNTFAENYFRCVLMLSCALTLPTTFAQSALPTANESNSAVDANLKWQGLLSDLGSHDFVARSAASAKLKQLSAEEIVSLAKQAHDSPNAEVVLRIQAEVETRYASQNAADVDAASRILETQVHDDRLMLADVAQQSLRQHWQKRIDIAVEELKTHGAIVRNGSFTRARNFNPFPGTRSDKAYRILITESWTGGSPELAIFERLGVLCGPVSAVDGIQIFLLHGHPLSDEQESKLLSVVGQNRVAKRSRVALGIVSTPGFARGVLIDQVTPGSSAADAGLVRGDLIVAIEPKRTSRTEDAPPKADDPEGGPDLKIVPAVEDKSLLRDFDDLVDRLMDYREGEYMTIRVKRGFGSRHGLLMNQFGLPQEESLPEIKEETIRVKMKGWADLIPE